MNHTSPRFETRIILPLVAAKVLTRVLFSAADTFGYFRDELYYLACTEHIEAGYE